MTAPGSTVIQLRELVLLRYVLVIAVAYLVVEEHANAPGQAILIPVSVGVAVAAALASNVLLAMLPPATFTRWRVATFIVVIDTVWISTMVAFFGHADTDVLFLYFFVIFFAALAENLLLMLVGIVGTGAAYLWVLMRLHAGPIWTAPVLLRLTFLFSAGLFYGVLATRARSEHRRAEIAESNDRERTEILASIAHDIEGPASVISLGVDTVREKLDAGDAVEVPALLAMVGRNVGQLTQLAREFMEYAQMSGGRHSLHPVPLSVEDVLAMVAAQYAHRARQSKVTLTVASEPMPQATLDELALVRILGNLVGNAIRHSPVGGEVRLEARPAGDGIRLIVSDRGPGLGESQRRHFGEAFVDAPRSHGGVGLGLFIVRSLVEAQGGALACESEPGRGTRIFIWLPLVAASSALST